MMWGIRKWIWREWNYVYVRKLRQLTQIYIFSVPIQTVCMWGKIFSFQISLWTFRMEEEMLIQDIPLGWLRVKGERNYWGNSGNWTEARMTNPLSSCRQGIQCQRVNNSRRGGRFNFPSEHYSLKQEVQVQNSSGRHGHRCQHQNWNGK